MLAQTKELIEVTPEIWKDAPGEFEDYYIVSNTGDVMRLAEGHGTGPGKILKPYAINRRGYMAVDLSVGGKKTRKRVHRLVVETFIGPIPEGFEVNHKDLDKANNRRKNLEVVTHQENIAHAWRNGAFEKTKRL